MWTIAIKTLIADRGKLLTALVGVAFSVVLVNVQGGLFLGLLRKASLLVDYCDAQIWIGHKQMHNVDLPRDIPRRWADRIRAVPGVARAEPYLLGFSDMTLPGGGFEGILVVGVEPSSLLGNAWNIQRGEPEWIRKTDGVIVDACDDDKLASPQLGDVREVGGRRARVVAKSHGIAGFMVAPYVFTTYDRAIQYLRKPPDVCSYFLVELEPGVLVDQACADIRRVLPEAEVFPKEVYSRISVNFWMTRTGLGISFGASTMLGLLVGLVMVAQTLYALVLDRLAEFATLKAIGARERQVFQILFVQTLVMAVVGSALGLAVVSMIQHVFSNPRAPILIPIWLSLGSCILITVICLVSSLLPYLRIRSIDPQMVLQG